MNLTRLLLVLLLAPMPWAVQAQTNSGQEQYLRFTIGSLGGLNEVEGYFTDWNIELIESNSQAQLVRLSIPVDKINTGIDRRDKALMEEEYFDAKSYPFIIVEALLHKSNKGRSEIRSVEISIKGISKQIELANASYLEAVDDKLRVKGRAALDRYDWKIASAGSFSISRQLWVDFNLVLPIR